MYKKLLLFIGIPVFVLLLLFLFRYSLMRGAANFLVCEDSPSQTQIVFVLSGAPLERSLKGAELFKNGFGEKFICTGRFSSHLVLLLTAFLDDPIFHATKFEILA